MWIISETERNTRSALGGVNLFEWYLPFQNEDRRRARSDSVTVSLPSLVRTDEFARMSSRLVGQTSIAAWGSVLV